MGRNSHCSMIWATQGTLSPSPEAGVCTSHLSLECFCAKYLYTSLLLGFGNTEIEPLHPFVELSPPSAFLQGLIHPFPELICAMGDVGEPSGMNDISPGFPPQIRLPVGCQDLMPPCKNDTSPAGHLVILWDAGHRSQEDAGRFSLTFRSPWLEAWC